MPRGLPGALALGLLASLVAHATIFDGDHTMGGAYHALLLQVAAAACVALIASYGALAWNAAGRISDGSVLASRVAANLPGFGAVFFSAAGWFVLAESLEAHHEPAPVLATALALALAAWLLLVGTRTVLRVLAKAVLAIARTPFSPRLPSWTFHPPATMLPRRSPLLRRRFARPPPTVAGRA